MLNLGRHLSLSLGKNNLALSVGCERCSVKPVWAVALPSGSCVHDSLGGWQALYPFRRFNCAWIQTVASTLPHIVGYLSSIPAVGVYVVTNRRLVALLSPVLVWYSAAASDYEMVTNICISNLIVFRI